MKLICTLPVCKLGYVPLEHNKKIWKFVPDEYGTLIGEVDDEDAVAVALRSGNFHPADSEEMDDALELTKPKKTTKKAAKKTDAKGDAKDDEADQE